MSDFRLKTWARAHGLLPGFCLPLCRVYGELSLKVTTTGAPPALDETRTSIEDTPASLDVTTTPAEPTIFLPDL